VTVEYEKADGTPTTDAAAGDSVVVTAPFVFKTPLVERFGVTQTVEVRASARLETAVIGGCQ
jgi:hypothetical protein